MISPEFEITGCWTGTPYGYETTAGATGGSGAGGRTCGYTGGRTGATTGAGGTGTAG